MKVVAALLSEFGRAGFWITVVLRAQQPDNMWFPVGTAFSLAAFLVGDMFKKSKA